jgi:hypothetical protein
MKPGHSENRRRVGTARYMTAAVKSFHGAKAKYTPEEIHRDSRDAINAALEAIRMILTTRSDLLHLDSVKRSVRILLDDHRFNDGEESQPSLGPLIGLPSSLSRRKYLRCSRPMPWKIVRTYALRGCSRALLAGSKPALASCSQVAAGGDRWLLMAVRGHLGYVFGNRLAGSELDRVYQRRREPGHRTSEWLPSRGHAPVMRRPSSRPGRAVERPSVFQAGHIPSCRAVCERSAQAPTVVACLRSLLLLSPLLSAQHRSQRFR